MANIYVKSGGGTKNNGDYRGVWTTAGNWAVGDRVVSTASGTTYKIYECTTSGAGDAAEPTWNTTTGGTTTMVAGAVFTTRIPSTWANATIDLQRASAGTAAGDTVYISNNHAESNSSAQTFTGSGTNASPVLLLCGNDSAEPPTSLATTATVTTTGANAITLNRASYWYGTTFISGAGIALNGTNVNATQRYENCSFQTTYAGSGGLITTASAQNVLMKTSLYNCTFKFAHANNAVSVFGDTTIEGGSVLSGSTTPTSIFKMAADRSGGTFLCSGFDFSNCASTVNLCSPVGVAPAKMVFRDCKLPASWSGLLVAAGSVGLGQRYEMYNCDSTDTNYRLWVEDYCGSIKSETTIVRTSGASDGTTALSWKMATSSTAQYPLQRLESPEMHAWNSTLSSVAVTVEIVHDTNVAGGQGAGTGSRFQDNEIWLEVMYLGTSGYPLGTWISDCKADVLATAADQADSSEAWTTTGLTTPQKQKLSVTIVPAEVGYIVAKVVMAKASKTIYVCPKLTVA